MLRIGNYMINVKHFPDNTEMLLDVDMNIIKDNVVNDDVVIKWIFESDEEIMTLYHLVNHLRDKKPEWNISLALSYIPNARMDRVKSDSEVLTLKYFSKFINSLEFKRVYSLDPHSNVAEALIDRLVKENVRPYIDEVVDRIWKYTYPNFSGILLYFPDEGAMKRYKGIVPGNFNIIYGKKTRDWKTGQITGLEVVNEGGYKIKGSIVLMIDDIISYGGTLAYSADKLRELGASNVFAYASHTENSVDNEEKGTLLKRLNDGTVTRLYTTDSLYLGNNPKIEIIKINQ